MKTTRKYCLFIVMTLFFMAFIAMPAQAFFDSNAVKAEVMIKKAVELKEIGLIDESTVKFKEAETLLKEALTKDTSDLDALYVLGVLNYCQNQKQYAEKRFQIVYSRNPAYGSKIRNFYLTQSQKAKKGGRLDQAIVLAVKAYNYESDPNKKTNVAEEFFRTGSKHLFDGNFQHAILYYRASAQLVPDYRQVNTTALITACKGQTDPRKQLFLLYSSLEFSDQIQSPYIIQAAEYVGQQLKKNNIRRAAVTKELNRFTGKYKKIEITIVRIAWPPDYIVYKAGQKKVFKLAKGNYSDHWIRPEWETAYKLQSKQGAYEVHTRSGLKFKKGQKLPRNIGDFRVYATTNCDMRIIFLKYNEVF